MTYIDYINAFWIEHRRGAFSPGEIALYFALLEHFNLARSGQGWPAKLPISNALLCGFLGISPNGLRTMRNGLKQRGLIDFGAARSKREQTVYRIRRRAGGRGVREESQDDVNNSVDGCTKSTQQCTSQCTPSCTQPDYIGTETETEEKTPFAPLLERGQFAVRQSRRRREPDPVKAEAQREFALREKRKRLGELKAERSLIVPNPAAAEISELYASQERRKDRERERLSKEIVAIEAQIAALNGSQNPRRG